MASNKIIQSDNAVIDYTTISVMIDTLNNQQKAIEDLQAAITHSQVNVDPATGTTTTVQGTQKIAAGIVQVTSPTINVSYSFSSKPTSLVGTILSNSSTNNGYAYISKTITNTGATFTYVGKTAPTAKTTGLYLYWIAVGIQ